MLLYIAWVNQIYINNGENKVSSNLFKSAIGGYNKAEVDEYALHISRKMELLKKEYEKKLEILEVENKKLLCEKQAAEDKLCEDEAIIAAFRAKLAEEIGKESDVDFKSEDNELLQKSKRYDEISSLLGEIIANATADAAATKREADEAAEKIIADAKEKARDIRASAVADLKRLTNEFAEKLSAAADDGDLVPLSDGKKETQE